MKFYKEQHQCYAGIDLHAKTMYVCIMDNLGAVVYRKNMPSTPEHLQHALAPYGSDIVAGLLDCRFLQ